jgi:hypothetical protein
MICIAKGARASRLIAGLERGGDDRRHRFRCLDLLNDRDVRAHLCGQICLAQMASSNGD